MNKKLLMHAFSGFLLLSSTQEMMSMIRIKSAKLKKPDSVGLEQQNVMDAIVFKDKKILRQAQEAMLDAILASGPGNDDQNAILANILPRPELSAEEKTAFIKIALEKNILGTNKGESLLTVPFLYTPGINLEPLKLLIAHNADVNVMGSLPLTIAADFGNLEAIKILLDNGAMVPQLAPGAQFSPEINALLEAKKSAKQ